MLESTIRDLLLAARKEALDRDLQAEFFLHREKSNLIRLGNSSVALSTHEELTRLDVSVQDGRKVGSYGLTADITSKEQLLDALDHAAENCRAALPKDYDPIFAQVEEAIDDSSGFDPGLEKLSAGAKTALCKQVVDELKPKGRYDFSGSWSSGSAEMYMTSTANENEAYRRLTDSRFVMVLREQDKKWELSAERTGKVQGTFTAKDVVAELTSLLPVYEGNEPYQTETGRLRVLFGPQAIAQLLSLALWGGFFGRTWEEKRSYTAGNKPGDKLFSDQVTIVDDPTHPDVFGMPFDFNGKTRRPFTVVEKGVFKALLYDSMAAAKYRRKPTGHDLGNTDFVLRTGTGKPGIAGGLEAAGDALYIPHLHYIHMPDPTKGLFTGSSRFNAMRILDGRFSQPMVSTRVTDTSPSVFSNVVAMSSHSVPQNESNTYGRREPEAMSVPEWMLCENVRISDVADSF
jgi:predicted Zn-dependent protease